MKSLKINAGLCGIKTGIIDYKESNLKSLLDLNSTQNFCQIVPLHLISSNDQIFFSFEQAQSAINSNTSFSKKLNLEFLIRLFGEKQLERVFYILNFKRGKNEVVLICFQNDKSKLNFLFEKVEKILEFKEKKILLGKNKKELTKIYGISKKEIQTLKDLKDPLGNLIIEKNSLVVFET